MTDPLFAIRVIQAQRPSLKLFSLKLFLDHSDTVCQLPIDLGAFRRLGDSGHAKDLSLEPTEEAVQ